ncbi:hypothetical protein PMI07_001405 [Rhizobium sp. CF080]|uniref:hypothetical protein n=1 Tax=Rhizobium sp. (strain CF080) TaxID=1144310 RepID=UPI0002717809|nr:hypothetical protein [Rhizobium sp. CF080]EUB96506.1 hypothetical protein PMI07_001405 [Rhizobium sp. CF080]
MAHDDKTDPPVTASPLALAIEEDLRFVEGIAAVLRHLGEGREPIEPGAIATLAFCLHEPTARIVALRRAASRADGTWEEIDTI